MLKISESIEIDDKELEESFVRASGPGGQNVNKVATAVQLRLNVYALRLPPEVFTRFRQLAENIHEVFWVTDLTKDRMLYISPAYEAIWGRSCVSLLAEPATLRTAPRDDAEVREEVAAGRVFNVLDIAGKWAWGQVGEDGRP